MNLPIQNTKQYTIRSIIELTILTLFFFLGAITITITNTTGESDNYLYGYIITNFIMSIILSLFILIPLKGIKLLIVWLIKKK